VTSTAAEASFLQRMPPRVRIALLLSLLAHALLLRIFLGGQTFGLPGLDTLWNDRRAGADNLRIALAPAPAPVPTPVPEADPSPAPAFPPASPPASPPAPAAVASVPAPVRAEVVAPPPPVPVIVPPAPAPLTPVITARTPSDVKLPVQPELPPAPVIAPAVAPAVVPETPPAVDPAIARKQAEDAAAAQAQLARETARLEQVREAQAEAARQEAARQEAARQETARRDAVEREAVRQAQQRQEQMKQDQIKQEQMKQDQIKQEQLKQDQLKQDQLNQARQDRADQDAKREERLQAIGAQMKQEAAQRDAASGPSRSLLPGYGNLRRGLLLGRADANAELVKYAEAMGRKIELNQTFDIVRPALQQPHAQPMITVAIRADGSVEKVTFVVSSGVPALDEAIRQVIASQAPYGAFSPALARQYDVVEIRRTWVFDTAIRLQ
jgi:outer membrane biosynthesis protein TonB